MLDVDEDGVALARPFPATEDAPQPHIQVLPDNRAGGAIASGDRILARIERLGPDSYEARTMRRLPRRNGPDPGRHLPANRRRRPAGADRPAGQDRLHHCKPRLDGGKARRTRARGNTPRAAAWPAAGPCNGAKLGRGSPVSTASLIAIASNDIPDRFSDEAIAEAEAAVAATLGQREDLRDVPLVTIDDESARDFDDAVWAETDPDGGFRLIVAIADVAWYVRLGSALDEAARLRGNSVYFPDRVVPMLPEPLSNGWCSLKPGEDRPCLAVHLRFDAEGRKREHRFVRGLMRSAARLTYTGVQATIEGARPSSESAAPVEALHRAFSALRDARRARGALDLEIPERRVRLGEDGSIAAIERHRMLDAHRLIEEFMIAANVAAAETLEAKRALCVYRVHDSPDPKKIDALREMLGSLGLSLPRGGVLRASHFSRLLDRVAGTPQADPIGEAILRTQAQAVYSSANIGHFGLALGRYAHFTSPIRRYADLMVHRSLIAACGLGEGGFDGGQKEHAEATAGHVSTTERRAAVAERDAIDRLCAIYLADRIGGEFAATITGITRAGLFVRLDETGASALVPLSSMSLGPLRVDERGGRLTDRRGRPVARLGDALRVRLDDVKTRTGSLVCSIV